jgi:hypothetical protein
VNWINSIRNNKPIEMAADLAVANLAAIMGRESAYTGQEVTWDQISSSALDYTPADLDLTKKMDMSSFIVAIPGKPQGNQTR